MRCTSKSSRSAIMALTITLATAAGSAPPRGLIVRGTMAEGDTPNDYQQVIDLRTGYTRRTEQMGPSVRQYGFYGRPWSVANGILTVSNLPTAVAREATLAWIDRQAWRETMIPGGKLERRLTPPGGNPVTLEFDPATGRVRQATVDADDGPMVVTFGDWRPVGSFTYPFHREQVASDGERTTIQIQSAEVVGVIPKGDLAPPPTRSHAEPIPGGTTSIPFDATGASKSHILVKSIINGRPASLIFDTGAANYLTTEAAPTFGVQPSGGVNIGGVGESSSTGGYAVIDRIALGNAVLRDETIVVGPAPWPPVKGGPDGLTGFEFFAEYVTTIDYPGQLLRFASALPRSSHGLLLPFYNDDSHIYVKATIDGIEGLFGIDTGDGGTVTIFPGFASRNHLKGASGAVSTSGGGMGGDVRSQRGVLTRFSLGGLNFAELPVSFSHQKTGAFASKGIAGNLGAGVLQCFRITIDFPHHVVLFDPAPTLPTCGAGARINPVSR